MKEKVRRTISFLLSVIILLSMLPGAALGAEVEGAADEAAENTGITETEEESADIGTEQEDVPTEEENEPSEDEPTEEDGSTEEESEPSEDELTEDIDESAADENDSLETEEETTEEEPEASDAEAIAEDGTDQTITYDLTLEYDDHWSLSDYLSEDLTGYTISGIQTNTVTSYQVSGGKKTKTRDTSVVTANGTNGLIASGVGTATVTLSNSKTGDQATLSVTVEPATLTVMLVAGQSNAEGKSSSSTGTHPEDSVLCEEGQVYSTYAPSTTSNAKRITGISSLKACTESTASAFVAASLTSSVSLAGSKLVYPLNALTESGKGKSGPDSGLAYQWNALTGDKVWVVNAAYTASSITTWVPGGTNYERALAVFQYAQTTASAEIAAGHYTQGKTLLFWLQGEADANMSASNYLSYFSKMKKGFTSEGLGIKYYGLIMVRASNGHVTSDDLIMTGPRLAQYSMGNSTSYSNVYVVSNVNEQWVTDSGVKSYFRSIYGSELTYPLRKKSTLSGLPTSVSEVHSDVHYSQVAHNENGLTAAQTMYDIVYGSSSSSISVQWYGPSGTALSSGTAVTLAMGSTYSYVPVVTPLSQSKKVSISYSTSSFSYNSSTGQLTATASGTATLTAKVGKVSAALKVTVNNTPQLTSVSASNSGITIAWNKVTGAAKYRVFRKTGSSGSWTKLGDTKSTSYRDTTAKSGTTYYYTVRCINSSGTKYTSGYDKTGLSIKAAATPTLSSVSANSSGVTVTWKAATGAVKYRVYRKVSGGSWSKIAVTTSTSYTDTTAAAGTTYYYSVRCVNAADSQFTSGYDTTGLSITRAATPTLSSVYANNNGVYVKWTAATGAVKYRVYRKTSGSSWTRVGVTTSTSYTDTTAKAGTTYYYTVRCV
ncbi:MAG: hypothetical protein LIO45_02530, partial [Clostridiales bacterium]|nr:hypothetical protein [Clostridiales bacterium]